MNIPEIFGKNVFSESVMEKTLSKTAFNSLLKTINEGAPLDVTVAYEVANAMKDWAISKGATHYSHWFQPMTGITAEKHDSFISHGKDGNLIMDFSGKELIKGEPDASSFPSGGIRATFEARGYTAWDPTSFAFVKDDTLYIPTAFCSYSGEALDKKTPLLRSNAALYKQVKRVLHLFGNDSVKSVTATAGPEQEYFLIDKKTASKRRDLYYTGRTLFGAKSPKGQELDDHYFGALKPRVKEFMANLDEELWKLGIYAKTEHNEAAPAQHELAPIYTNVNIANDHNQLTMELMKKVADKHGLLCLLHEKPFEGVNGSGKHNNWSLSTDTGTNLLDPGDTPLENMQFLLFFVAVIKAVDDYQDLLRISVASAGNDHRLGANEAPPAIISMFIGEDLNAVLEALVSGGKYSSNKTFMGLGAKILPKLPKDGTDRNRTSPIAFTGNKFEFRMLGSSASVADANIIFNTAVAESLKEFADELEKSNDFEKALHNLLVENVKLHKRIIFNGNNYSSEWIEEAGKRGLKNLPTTADCIPYMTDEKNLNLFESHGVYTRTEIFARQEIAYTNYTRIVNIEALTMLEMARKDIYPAVNKYISELCKTAELKEVFGAENKEDKSLIKKLSMLNSNLIKSTTELESLINKAKNYEASDEKAKFYKDSIISCMTKLRAYADEMESLSDAKYWPFPTYGDLLFSVE